MCLLSYDHVLFVIVLAELSRSASSSFFEDTVEVRDIVEATAVANLHHSHSAIGKHTSGMTQSNVNDIFRDAFPRSKLKESAKGSRRH